ncbi:MAG: hypothetical protein NW241_13120 [Bacteroidia bacterium]|nr:hypothetical protein [Bacteroidia bacterium]
MERRHERISAAVTAGVVVLIALFSIVWKVFRNQVPPPGAKYEMVGSFDFGDSRQGNKNINNFSRAVPEPQQVREVQEPTARPTPPAPSQNAPVQTQPAPSPVVTPSQPAPAPAQPTQQPSQQPSKPKVDDVFTYKPSNGGGSNQGQGGDVGNSGSNVKTLDPRGMYGFTQGDGEGGIGSRDAISLPYPEYNVQEEGTLSFEFFIEPNGSVSYAKALPNNKPNLARLGEAAIRNWRFSQLPGGQGGRQKVRVTMTFKLRG